METKVTDFVSTRFWYQRDQTAESLANLAAFILF